MESVFLGDFDLCDRVVWLESQFLPSCESYYYSKAKVSKNLMPLVEKCHFTRHHLFITMVFEIVTGSVRV